MQSLSLEGSQKFPILSSSEYSTRYLSGKQPMVVSQLASHLATDKQLQTGTNDETWPGAYFRFPGN